jgi:hypothetical protein
VENIHILKFKTLIYLSFVCHINTLNIYPPFMKAYMFSLGINRGLWLSFGGWNAFVGCGDEVHLSTGLMLDSVQLTWIDNNLAWSNMIGINYRICLNLLYLRCMQIIIFWLDGLVDFKFNILDLTKKSLKSV